MGLHGYDAGYMVIQAVSAIMFGYFGGIMYGMEGILLGLTLPTLFFTLIHKGIVISKKAFEISSYKYLKDTITDLIKGITIILIVYVFCNILPTINPIIDMILRGILSIILSILLIVIFSFKNEYFKETTDLLKRIVEKKKS